MAWLDKLPSSPGSMECPPRHSCLSLQSGLLLCASFPWVPWRCEGHSPQVSLPPQAQDPSTGCSWSASSYGSAPGARRGGEDRVKSGQERAGPGPAQHELESLEGGRDNHPPHTLQSWEGAALILTPQHKTHFSQSAYLLLLVFCLTG